MKRLFLWILGLGVVIGGGLLTAGYFYAQAHITEIPPIVQQSLKTNGIDFKYSAIEKGGGLSIVLRNLSIEGKDLDYPVHAATAKFSIRLAFSPKPIIIGLNLEKPQLRKLERKTPATPPPPAAPTKPHFFLGPLLSLVQFEAGVTQADLPDFGVMGLTASVRARSFGFGPKGLEKISLTHDILVEKLTKVAWLPSVHTEGDLTYNQGAIAIDDSTVEAGPFKLGVEGNVDLNTKLWKASLSLPETELSSASKYISARSLSWLTKVGGKLGIKVDVEGYGFSEADGFDMKQATGSLSAKKLVLTVNHPSAKGDVAVDANGKFTVQKNSQFTFVAKADLSEAEIMQGEVFKKGKGIPLTLATSGEGKDKAVSLKEFTIKFHNLSATGSGDVVASENPSGNIDVKIAETSLSGWEQFFPRYAGIKTKGTIGGTVKFQGPFKELNQSTLNVDLKAKDVVFPLLAEWFPKGTTADGVAELNSDTQLSLSNGVLNNLATTTRVDLTNADIKMEETFEKAKKTPLFLNVEMATKGKKADISKGVFRLGSLNGWVKGAIENFQNPSANIVFGVDSFPAEELRKFSPMLRKNATSPIGGQIALKGNINGPLTDAKKPLRYEAQLALKTISFQYQLESKKKIDVRNISGPLVINQNGAQVNHLVFQSPGTSATLDMKVVSFDKPNITFSLKADRFRMEDFHESQDQGKKKAVGFAAVPTSGNAGKAGKEEDFRKNPWLKKVKLSGDVVAKNADLGYTKSDLITAKIKYENLLLTIDPMTMKTFGGTVTTATVWDGRKEIPTSTMTMKANDVDANQFVSNWSDKAKDTIFGRLNTDFTLQFSGMTAEDFKKSAGGKGDFHLLDGTLKTVGLTQKPLEALRKIPGLTNLNAGAAQEKLNQINGAFTIDHGKIAFSDLIIRAKQFDAQTTQLSLDFDMNINARLAWMPKEELIGKQAFDLLKDGSGRAVLPLTLNGSFLSPQVGVDSSAVASQLQQNAARRVTEEAKSKLKSELEKSLKGGLKGLFK